MVWNSRRPVRYLALPVAAIVSASFFAGCADTNTAPTTQAVGIRARQDKALKDPFSVGGVDQMEKGEKYDVSGGGISDFDKKSFKKDVDSVFNP